MLFLIFQNSLLNFPSLFLNRTYTQTTWLIHYVFGYNVLWKIFKSSYVTLILNAQFWVAQEHVSKCLLIPRSLNEAQNERIVKLLPLQSWLHLLSVQPGGFRTWNLILYVQSLILLPLPVTIKIPDTWLWKAIQFLIWWQLLAIKPMEYVLLKMVCLGGCTHIQCGSNIIYLKYVYLLQILEMKSRIHGD